MNDTVEPLNEAQTFFESCLCWQGTVIVAVDHEIEVGSYHNVYHMLLQKEHPFYIRRRATKEEFLAQRGTGLLRPEFQWFYEVSTD